MASGWHFHGDATPTPGEVEAMVAVLEGRHGAWAADVAEFFSTLTASRATRDAAGRGPAWPKWCAAGRQARLGEQCP